MTATLSNGTDTIAPWDRLGFEARNAGGAIVHRRLDGVVDVSLAPDSPRAGSLVLGFLDADTAEAARQLLIQPAVWTVSDPVGAVDGMRFVRVDELEQAQQDDRRKWILTVGFQEVPA
jgi:hypothetical protein